MFSINFFFLSRISRVNIRAASSLAPNYRLQGTRWDYQIIDRINGDKTHSATILKAKVLSRENDCKAPQWAIIKKALPGDDVAMKNLNRERQIHLLPTIASTRCFRQMYDTFRDQSIALKWLETTLADIKYQPTTQSYTIVKAVLREILTSCDVLAGQNYVNTDYKPANVLLSEIETSQVTAKVGDLGLVVLSGQLINAQPYAMRAPEVFLGQPCTEPSQVWAVAAMLLCWIKPGLLGAGDSPHLLLNEAWCMAKIKRLFPDWDFSVALNEAKRLTVRTAIEHAVSLSEEEEILQAISPFDEESLKMVIPEELKKLLRLMFIIHPHARPSASDLLKSEEFRKVQSV